VLCNEQNDLNELLAGWLRQKAAAAEIIDNNIERT